MTDIRALGLAMQERELRFRELVKRTVESYRDAVYALPDANTRHTLHKTLGPAVKRLADAIDE